MTFETLLNVFNPITDEEICASLTPSFCPEIIDLLNSERRQTKRVLPRLMSAADYGFDEHAYGLA
ncbi:MAG: hypothetical protein WCL34_06330 [Methylococcaceae bacterium]|jgi:hypothetical protein